MRESRKKEKTHLPRDSTEIWLESQTATQSEAKHRNPPEDTYEAWIEKRVGESRGLATRSKKTTPDIPA
jgi:hypothetical protein